MKEKGNGIRVESHSKRGGRWGRKPSREREEMGYGLKIGKGKE